MSKKRNKVSENNLVVKSGVKNRNSFREQFGSKIRSKTQE